MFLFPLLHLSLHRLWHQHPSHDLSFVYIYCHNDCVYAHTQTDASLKNDAQEKVGILELTQKSNALCSKSI